MVCQKTGTPLAIGDTTAESPLDHGLGFWMPRRCAAAGQPLLGRMPPGEETVRVCASGATGFEARHIPLDSSEVEQLVSISLSRVRLPLQLVKKRVFEERSTRRLLCAWSGFTAVSAGLAVVPLAAWVTPKGGVKRMFCGTDARHSPTVSPPPPAAPPQAPADTATDWQLGPVPLHSRDRVASMTLRNKAQEAVKGGPLDNECNAVAKRHGRNPSGSCLFAPMAVLRLLPWGPPRSRRRALPCAQTSVSATIE